MRRAINILVRFVIIGSSVLVFLEFSELIWLELNHLNRHFSLFTVVAGIFGPALAIAAMVLAAVNRYLPLAALFAVSALAIFITPLVVFFGFAK
jgi:hypothetical protein